MLSLDALPADILLQIVASLSLHDIVSLSMVSKSFNGLSQEHSFWLTPLRMTRLYQPLPCPNLEDLATRTTRDLKKLALHTVRLARNWSKPFLQITGPVRTLRSEVHNNILFCLPGTDAIVLYSLVDGTIVCCDMQTGVSSAPMFLGRVNDMSSPLEEPHGVTVAALVNNRQLLVVTASIHPTLSTRITFQCNLDPGYHHAAVFMNSEVVGVARTSSEGSGIEVQTFNILQPDISTTIITDRPPSPVLGSTVIGETIYFIIPQLGDAQAFVYACPRRLLAYRPPAPDIDYSIRRSHVARIPRPSDDPEGTRSVRAYCVLSTEPNYGRNTISVANAFSGTDAIVPHSLQITFWPRPEVEPRSSFTSEEEYDRAEGRMMLPARTVSVPGSLSSQPGRAWELIVISNSGLVVVLVVDPPPPDVELGEDQNGEGTEGEGDSNGDGDGENAAEGGEEPPLTPPPPPKLMLARYDPVLNSASLHELQIPPGIGENLDTRNICALSLDDGRGIVIVITSHDIVHYIPYA
ncbi:hypothetical protein B0H11DRAFT_619467 [Mycena galericulata]|nr:hypothetical protein B0H11DRAFT_619467 [Mycena galericulata]